MNVAKKPKCPKCNSTRVLRNSKGLICGKCGYANKQEAELKIITYG
jgi:ribosomal protein S27AE